MPGPGSPYPGENTCKCRWADKYPPDVEIAFHCLALHEARAPFHPTFMRGPNAHQVLFPGVHSHLGWIEEKEGLVHAPFAWMIQQLHTHLGLSFDEKRLVARFPSYRPAPASQQSPPSDAAGDVSSDETHVDNPQPPWSAACPPEAAPELTPGWYQGRIHPYSAALLAVVGKKTRGPGRMTTSSSAASSLAGLQVHVGARLRAAVDDDPVPGYKLVAPVTGRPYWVRCQPSQTNWPWRRTTESRGGSSSGSGSGGSGQAELSGGAQGGANAVDRWPGIARRLEEARIGRLEARLLGLPEEAVDR